MKIEKAIELFVNCDTVTFTVTGCGEESYQTIEFENVVEALEKQLNDENLEEQLKSLQDENIGLKTWNACEQELYEKLLADSERLIEVEAELTECKDLEEQGLLIKLPCKVGDVVYLLGGKDYNKFRVGCVDWKSGMEYKGKNYQLYMEDNYYDKAYRNFSDIGKTVFLTREEAEKALEVE